MSATAEALHIPARHNELHARQPAAEAIPKSDNHLVTLALTNDDIEACQRLRHAVFAREAHGDKPGLDRDAFDPYCHHVMVKNRAGGELLATTRILTDENAALAGRFYLETEFELRSILRLNGRFMEIGRTCVDPAHRHGHALSLLWQGVARVAIFHRIDYLIGCAGIPLSQGDAYVEGVIRHLNQHHMSLPEYRARPRIPLPRRDFDIDSLANEVALPPLLNAYLRQGAQICSAPHWDAQINVANVLVLLGLDRLINRYTRYFFREH